MRIRSPLNYASDGRPIARRRLLRISVVALLVVMGGSAVWRWGPSYLGHLDMLSAQRRLMSFDPPPGTLAFTNIAAECPPLIALRTHVQMERERASMPTGRPQVGYRPAEAAQIEAGTRRTSASSMGTVFLHRLKTPSGEDRLVHVLVQLDWGFFRDRPARFISGDFATYHQQTEGRGGGDADHEYFELIQLVPRIYRPATWRLHSTRSRVLQDPYVNGNAGFRWPRLGALLIPDRVIPDPSDGPGRLQLDRAPLRVFADRPDPSDPSRILISYECGGKPGNIAGRLTDEDVFEWTVVDGPLLPWPEPLERGVK